MTFFSFLSALRLKRVLFAKQLEVHFQNEELRGLRCFFAPPPPQDAKKSKTHFSPISFYKLISTIVQALKSGINLTFTVAMETKVASKITENRKVAIVDQVVDI